MQSLELQLKEMIIEKFGNLKKFTETVNMPWTTLDSVLKRGINNSNITNVIKICEGLNIDCESLYYGKIKVKSAYKTNEDFSQAEQSHIKKYRTLDEYGKKAVDSTLELEYNRVHSCNEDGPFINFDSAFSYLTSIPTFAMGGYDIENMDKEELIDFANDMYEMDQRALKLFK